MLTHAELFFLPGNVAKTYLGAVKDVYKELEAIIIKRDSKDKSSEFKVGWNSCIKEISRRIKVRKGKL